MAPSQPRSKRNTTTEKKKTQADKRRDQLSFSKRKNGLFNKVTELSILCQSETAVIVTSKNNDGGEIFTCGYPSPDAVIQRFLTGGKARRREEVGEEKVEALSSEYEAVQERLKEEQRKLQAIMEEKEMKGSVFPSWWETLIDDMDLDSVEQFKNSMENLKLNLIARQRYCEMIPGPPQMMVAPPPSRPQAMAALPPPPLKNLPPVDAKFGVWVPCGQRVTTRVVESDFGSDSITFMIPPI
ncbi:agamous-like MADS-box protein AGL62 [Lotus japonicus]|uniref:agamous-like MADS-box protein AGL62 n=1 Tax=Lotus japonicus TaxID=34305 RepID=UPI00258D3941|nr:agamous-like MADS-box protein AGL62 [Lotus japonicus]